jgi:signal transduction histidine kinase
MMRIALLWMLCLLSPCENMAQAPLQSIDITTSEGEIPLAGKFYYLTDETGSMTSVQAMDSLKMGKFKRSENWIMNFGSYAPKVWICMIFENKCDKSVQLTLRLNHSNINILTSYIYEDGSMKRQYINGDFFPFRQRTIPNRNFLFPVNLAPSQKLCYVLHVDKFGQYLNIPVQLYHNVAFQQVNQMEYALYGLLLGVLIFVIVFNVFLGISLKDPVYFAYSLYISTAFFYFLANEGLGMEYIWGDLHRFNSYSKGLFPLAWGVSLIHFTQLFVKQNASDGLLFKLTQTCKIALTTCIVYVMLHWLLDMPFTPVNMNVWRIFIEFFYAMAMILLFVIVLRSARRGNKSAGYYLWATSLFWAVVSLHALNRTGILETSFIFTSMLFPIGIILEIFILSFGLSIRYHQFKRQNDLYQLELVQKEAELRTGIIRSQDSERARIAADLHDHLGGTIAVVNAKLSQLAEVESLPQMRDALENIQKISAQVGTEVRQIAHNLMPPDLEKTGLLESVRERLQSLTTPNFVIRSFGTESRLNPERELNLYRVIMELVSNIAKHACASEATIQFLYHKDMLTIIIDDNGLGYKETEKKERNGGIGLKSIHSRIGYLNGNLQIDQNANGTNLILEVPYNAPISFTIPNPDSRLRYVRC